MQPNSASQQYPPQGSYGSSGPAAPPGFAPAAPQASLVRVRHWLVGTIAAIAMLALIAGLANQAVTDQIAKHNLNPQKFFDAAVYSTTVFGWRFSPRLGTDIGHVWIAGLIYDVLVVIVTLVLTAALAKNKRGFGGSFLAAWVGAFVAVQICAYVRGAIVNIEQLQGRSLSRATSTFFGTYSPGQFSLFAGLGFGLIAAVIAGAVGAASNRTEVLAEPLAAPLQEQRPEDRDRPQDRDAQQVWAAPPPPGPISSPSPWTTPERSDRSERTDRPDLDKRDDGPQPTAVLPVMGGNDRDDAARRTDDEADRTQAYRVRSEGEDDGDATQAHRVQQDDEADSTQAYRVRPEDERDRP